jgi:hypothetical protein
VGYSKREEVALLEEGRGCQRVIPGGEVGYTKRGQVAEGLFQRGRGCQRVILGGEVGYSKRGEVALFEEGRGCQRVTLGGEVGYTKRGQVAEGLFEKGERLTKELY